MFATQLAGSASSARLCAHRQLSQLRQPRSGLPLTRRGARCFATQQNGPEEQSTAGHTEDAYRTATIRLKELLKDASWDSTEAVLNDLEAWSPAMRLTFITNLGTLVALVAMTLAWATGEDPLGGISLSPHTAQAAMYGAMAAWPLVVVSLVARHPRVRRTFPVLEDLHSTQVSMLQPVLKDLSPVQLLITASCFALPTLLLLLPAMTGWAHLLGYATSTWVVEPLSSPGLPLPRRVLKEAAAAAAVAAPVVPAAVPDPGAAGATVSSLPLHDWAILVAMAPDSPGDVLDSAAASAATGGAAAAAAAASVGAAAAAAPEAVVHHVAASPSAAAMLLVEHAVAGPASVVAALMSINPEAATSVTNFLAGAPSLATEVTNALFGPDGGLLARAVGREALALSPAIFSGFLAAYAIMKQLAPKDSHMQAIRDALEASDRFFRLTVAMDKGVNVEKTTTSRVGTPRGSEMYGASSTSNTTTSTSSTSDPLAGSSSMSAFSSASMTTSSTTGGDLEASFTPLAASSSMQGEGVVPASTAAASAATSEAFKRVAVVWLLTRRRVCQLAYMLTACSVVYLALIWQEAGGDLAAPAAAALLHVLLELWLSQQEGARKKQQQE